ncbi:molybdopterin molybdotransferase MoeA [Parasedimentitalea psychrophila]|uniref:Molybdopterin molybdenumtransferase n=1 Tax=Parasedimentitalea psychrophila TaxID=2997337 RepID=A0A9Y2KYS2_9RHOB|nr:gephyrin-like molybdotransferase Glp [Parasedimentitalea psychrophila]WIY24924.1 molybdopterin molybdotransferase MoeA [Parasedimentitalea psychrophila]
MITVDDALGHLMALVSPLDSEQVPLIEAAGRVLATDVTARRDQPPFAASAMDGYAMRADEVEQHSIFKVIGESAAGHRFEGQVKPGQAVRIFTGAPVPAGADFVVIQEDISRSGDLITIASAPSSNANIRALGGDFKIGDRVTAPRLLNPSDIALLASMNIANVPVTRRPQVALISTGDELVMPGENPGPDQIIASNTFGLKAMLDQLGAHCRILPIARDTEASLTMGFDLAAGADLIITIGGASVGDHDLVGKVAGDLGLERSFYKVAMRPGKPLMGGRMTGAAMVGLPGNPVSAMVCGHIFIAPMIRCMLGLGAVPCSPRTASLSAPLPANGPRQHYMRAKLDQGKIRAFDRQDSALLTVLAEANALLIRPPNDPARTIGEQVAYLPL